MKDFNILVIQISNFKNNKLKSNEDIFFQIESAIKNNKNSKLVMLPELVVTPYLFNDETIISNNQILKNLERIKKIAKKYRKYILFNDTKTERSKIYNSSYFIDDKGSILGCYNKAHIPICEEKIFSAGDKFVVIDTPLAKFGIIICYDAHYPESFRILKKMGAEVVLLPINSCVHYHEVDIDIENWRSICKYNALVNSIYVVMSNKTEQIGLSNHFHTGHSMVVDPFGKVLSEASIREDSILVELRKDIYYKYQNTYEIHKRNDLYQKYGINKK